MSMLSEKNIDRLIDTIYGYLLQQTEGISEHQLLVELARQRAWTQLDKTSAVLMQFQKHFLTMHALYRLQDQLAGSNTRLRVSPTFIRLHRVNEEAGEFDAEGMPADTSSPALRDYYLDLNHLIAATEASIAEMVGNFWNKYHAWQKKDDAYAILGLPQGADWSEVQVAYRRKAALCHPDKGGSAEDFQRLVAAYQSIKRILRP